MVKTLNKEDTLYAANIFNEYFNNFGRIDEYMRTVKQARMEKLTPTLPGMGFNTLVFNDFSIRPEDMEFEIYQNDNEYKTLLNVTASHVIEDSIPGKRLKLIVKEKNTDTIVGFIRFGSPTMYSKPRNDWLGQVPDLKIFNKHTIMGFIIVPTQPFGFNYLGGKLLALLSVSHDLREMVSKKYETDICMFETTSLYGDIKGCSQYDGLKPFIRHNGLTTSKFPPLLHDNVYRKLNRWFIERVGELTKPDASGKKLRAQKKMVVIIRASLKKHGLINELKKFNITMKNADNLTTRKRSYYSTYGYDNIQNVLLGTGSKIKGQNYYKHEMNYIISWWKSKANKRYNNLISDGRLRTKVELWNESEEIDIIR